MLDENDVPTFRDGWKKMFHAYGNENKERIAILTANKIDFRPDC